MARVYLARDRFLMRQVAVKILHPVLSGDKRFLARFRREAESAAKLNHPHIVSVYDVGNDGDLYYIIMEYVPGLDLKELLLQSGTLPPGRVSDIGSQVASALQYAHEHGILHLDIKPHNVMVTPSGLAKVADFGIATLLTEAAKLDDGPDLGTAQYFAPEQARGGAVSPRTDIYSLGVMLYEAATGFLPFPEESAEDVAQAHISREPVPPSTLHTDVSPELERIIMRALAKNPRDRFASADEIGRALQEVERLRAATSFQAGAGATAAGVAARPPRRSARERSRRGGACLTWLIGLLTLTCVVGIPALLWQLGTAESLPAILAPPPTPTQTATATPTAASTSLPTATSTRTPTPLPTSVATSTPAPTEAAPPRPTFGRTPTPTPSPSPTLTPTPRPTNTPTPRPARPPRQGAARVDPVATLVPALQD